MTPRAVVFVVVAATACAAPRDAFDTAERALLAQDLPTALVAFDAVPVSHARYPEARAAALGVERRMRRGHELMLEGLLLRSEWRDDEALAVLGHAHEVWPGLPGVAALEQATRHRLQMLANDPHGPATAVTVTAIELPLAAPSFGTVGPGSAKPVTPIPPGAAVRPEEPAQDLPVPPVDPTSPVVQGLVAVETRLGRGELEGALADLLGLASRYPDSQHVRLRIARVLHQRALQRYGQGQLSAALSDWERVLAIDPSNDLARSLWIAVRAEGDLGTPASPDR